MLGEKSPSVGGGCRSMASRAVLLVCWSAGLVVCMSDGLSVGLSRGVPVWELAVQICLPALVWCDGRLVGLECVGRGGCIRPTVVL